jgi:hypothetical protein
VPLLCFRPSLEGPITLGDTGVTVSHLFNSPIAILWILGGVFELFVLEFQVGAKRDSKAVVIGQRQKLLAKTINVLGPQSGQLYVLIQ